MHRKDLFSRFSSAASHKAGQPLAFTLAFLIIVAWAILGPFFDFSNTWQWVINTGSTLNTFPMVFLI